MKVVLFPTKVLMILKAAGCCVV